MARSGLFGSFRQIGSRCWIAPPYSWGTTIEGMNSAVFLAISTPVCKSSGRLGKLRAGSGIRSRLAESSKICPTLTRIGQSGRNPNSSTRTSASGLCGNCSTFCEMGIDVKSYAQRGQNVIRSSCVGCGVCSEVCPRGVLRLENGPVKGRYELNKEYLR